MSNDQQQQQQIVQDQDEPPSLGWIFGVAAISIFTVGVLKWMFQDEIDHHLGIPPS